MSTRIHLENIQIATIPKYNNSNLPKKYLFKKCKILSSRFTPNLNTDLKNSRLHLVILDYLG